MQRWVDGKLTVTAGAVNTSTYCCITEELGEISMSKEIAIQLATEAANEEKQLAELEQKFALQSKEFATFLKAQQEAERKVSDMWEQVKRALIEADYTDVIENEHFKISLSRVFGFQVEDIEKLPDDYVEVVKQPKKYKIKKHFELYEELPAGVVEKSHYRLNKKVK